MKKAPSSSPKSSPLLFVLAAAILWSTGGLFIKWVTLSGLELSFGRSLLAAITVVIFTRHEGFGLNRVTALASVLYAALLLLFDLATKETTAANAKTMGVPVEEFRKLTAQKHLLKQAPSLQNIGALAAFMASDEGAILNSHIIDADYGTMAVI